MTLDMLALGRMIADAGPGPGRKPIFPDKRPGIVYLTPWAKQRLIMLAQNAAVSQSDLLEVLIRRYGIQAGSDIIAARGEPDHGTER